MTQHECHTPKLTSRALPCTAVRLAKCNAVSASVGPCVIFMSAHLSGAVMAIIVKIPSTDQAATCIYDCIEAVHKKCRGNA